MSTNNASSTSSSSTGSSSGATIGQDVKTALASADANVSTSLENLTRIHRARLSQATRTLTGLKAQAGATAAEIAAAEARVASAANSAARVSLIRQRITLPAVQVAKSGWALQGAVLTAQLQPAARFTVFLVDQSKSFLPQFGFAYTDDTGYFLLNYSPEAAAGAASGTAAGAAPAEAAGAAQGAPAPQLYIEVADTAANPVYLSPTAFVPVAGAASFQSIVLAQDGKPIGDPPPEIRAVALPPSQAKPKAAPKKA